MSSRAGSRALSMAYALAAAPLMLGGMFAFAKALTAEKSGHAALIDLDILVPLGDRGLGDSLWSCDRIVADDRVIGSLDGRDAGEDVRTAAVWQEPPRCCACRRCSV